MRKPFLQPQNITNLPQREVISVSQLNSRAKGLLEKNIGSIWIEGEISNFIQAASGHWYFTLKDNNAQIKCAIFKFKNQRLKISPTEGDKVIVKGKVSLYEARGDYQLIGDYMEPAGLGDLQAKLNQLISQMESKGLFSAEHKKTLPFLPKKIGVITSPTGAAIHDVLTVLERRCPMVEVIIYPTQVQGVTASKNIIRALKKAENRNECDVLLMTRGGGSLEDLWCFNDEELANEIFNCDIPIVAAIGHEVDVTITELVADLRAPTPSAAAELLVPDQQSLWQKVDLLNQDLVGNLSFKVNQLQNRLNIARLKLKDPSQAINHSIHQLEKLSARLSRSLEQIINSKTNQLNKLNQQLSKVDPKERLQRNRYQLDQLSSRIKNAIQKLLDTNQNQLAIAASQLNAMSPLSTLGRGYSITQDSETKQVISKINQVSQNQSLTIKVSDGEFDCKVNGTIKPQN